jgi:cytochrome c551/c552
MAWIVDGGLREPTRWLAVGALCALGACGDDAAEDDVTSGRESGDNASDARTPAPGSWCAAREVFQNACVQCHSASPSAGAPMSLETFADLQADAKFSKGKKVTEVVKSRVHDTAKPMPPQRTLKPAELAAIDDWIAAGAKAGNDPTCANAVKSTPPVQQDPWPPVGCEQVYELRAGADGQKAVIAAGTETHPQFYIDAPWGNDKVQALGFRPITDNKKVLHHWIVYENNGGRQGAFVTGWAPGQDDTARKALPDNVGIFLPTGPRSLRLDMHYFNLTGTQQEEDASGVEVCVTRSFRPITATTFQNFAAIPLIAPGADTDMVGTCEVQLTEPVFLMSESPHAHTLATWTKLEVMRGSEKFVLHDKAFRFEEQTATPITPFFELKQGDVVTTTCHYKNDSNRFVILGESTNSEMCFNFATYYPMGALSCAGGGVFGF